MRASHLGQDPFGCQGTGLVTPVLTKIFPRARVLQRHHSLIKLCDGQQLNTSHLCYADCIYICLLCGLPQLMPKFNKWGIFSSVPFPYPTVESTRPLDTLEPRQGSRKPRKVPGLLTPLSLFLVKLRTCAWHGAQRRIRTKHARPGLVDDELLQSIARRGHSWQRIAAAESERRVCALPVKAVHCPEIWHHRPWGIPLSL